MRSQRLILSALGLAAASAAAQTPQQFVIRKGPTDTVAVERFTNDGSVLTGSVTQTNGPRFEYMLLLRPDRSVEHLELARKPKQGTGITVGADFSDKGVKATVSAGGQSEQQDFAGPLKTIPFLAVSFAITEQVVRAAKLEPGQNARWIAVRLGVLDTATMTVTRFHRDSVSLAMADVTIKVALGPNGDVIGGSHSTQPWIVDRKR